MLCTASAHLVGFEMFDKGMRRSIIKATSRWYAHAKAKKHKRDVCACRQYDCFSCCAARDYSASVFCFKRAKEPVPLCSERSVAARAFCVFRESTQRSNNSRRKGGNAMCRNLLKIQNKNACPLWGWPVRTATWADLSVNYSHLNNL